ncbi:MAG TPA: YcaO-like family protein [Polyangiales bacterium]|nr:YcaO-like family protein [Polyangiales bacterium]
MAALDSVNGSGRQLFANTFRSCPPAETLARIAPWLGPAGITRVAVVTGLDWIGIPVVMVSRPAGRSLSVTQGKGPTLEAAKVSGLMEALEHYCAESIDAPLRYGSARELAERGHASCIPRAALRGSGSLQDEPLTWIAGQSLLDGSTVFVPFDLVHLDYRLPLAPSARHFLASSNGLASGNTEPEATCHALFELIEREHTQRFYDIDPLAQRARRVDPATVLDPVARELLDKLEAARVVAGVWDLSSELGVPCFLCDLLDAERGDFRSLSRARGFGCHSDRRVALTRALCEAAQSRLTMIAGSRDDISRRELAEARSLEGWSYAAQQLSGDALPLRSFEAAPSQSFASFEQERDWLLSAIERAGFGPPIVVSLSRPEHPFAVVRVLVPGMRAPHARARERAS